MRPCDSARPRLALDRSVDPRRATRALANHAGEKIVNRRARCRIACRLELRFLPREQDSAAIVNSTDGVRLDAFRVGRDCGKCARHLQQSNFAGAKRQARHRRQFGLHAELVGGVDDGLDSDGIGNLNRH